MSEAFGRGFSKLQVKVITFLVITFLCGVAIRLWQSHRSLPPVNAEIEERFQAIADSLNNEDAKEHYRAQLGESVTSKSGEMPADFVVNVNNASLEDLKKLPGVGEVMAARIIRYRDEHGSFKSGEDLLQVKGIGKKTLQRLQKHIAFE